MNKRKKYIRNQLQRRINDLNKEGYSNEEINEQWISICIDRTGLYHEG